MIPTLSRRSSSAPSVLALAIALAAPWALPGCGSDELPPPNARIRVLDLATELTPAPRTIERVGGFGLTEANQETCPWEAESSHGSLFSAVRTFGRFGARDEFRPVFVARGEGGFTIKHPVPFEWDNRNVLTALVTLWGSGTQRVRSVVLDEDGRALRRGPWLIVKRQQEPQVLRLAVPPRSKEDARMAPGIGLEFAGPGKHVALLALDVYRADVATSLPSLGEPELVSLQGDGRDAAGLVEGAPWSMKTVLTERSRLRVSMSWPSIIRRVETPPALVVRATGATGEILEETIRLDESKLDGWLDRELPLGKLGAGEALLEFEVRDTGASGDDALLLGDVVVVNPATEPPPTVLFVTSDTHRADYFGASPESGRAMTPVIDALAERGLAFQAAYATANVTNPSHIALMTGIHPRDTRIVDNSTTLSATAETLSEAYRRAGYRTLATISTQHLGPDQSGLGQGFDRFNSPLGAKRHGVATIEIARDWLAQSKGEPLFIWVHLFDAHAPYASADVDPSKYYEGDPRIRPEKRMSWPKEAPHWVLAEGIEDPAYVEALYRGQVEYLDDALHGLFAEPRVRAGWTAFTADHGESFGALGLWWDHIGLYHPTVAVPLVIVGPGVPVGVSQRPVGSVDLARTLLDVAGIPSEMPGRDLTALALSESEAEPLFAISAHGLQAAIFHGPWCLTLDLRSYSVDQFEHVWLKGRVRLFDRRRGLDTNENMVDAEPELVRRMRERLLNWLSQAGDGGLGQSADLDESATANLDALGYGGFTAKDEGAWWTEDDADPAWLERFED